MRLRAREKNMILVGALALVLILGYVLIVEPMATERDWHRSETIKLEKDIGEMRVLAAQYRAVAEASRRRQEQIQSRGQDFQPISYLETVARESGLTNQVESMTPVTTSDDQTSDLVMFDLRLGKLNLSQLVDFLYRVETGDKVVFVLSLNIKPRYLSPDILDVSLRLATPKAG